MQMEIYLEEFKDLILLKILCLIEELMREEIKAIILLLLLKDMRVKLKFMEKHTVPTNMKQV